MRGQSNRTRTALSRALSTPAMHLRPIFLALLLASTPAGAQPSASGAPASPPAAEVPAAPAWVPWPHGRPFFSPVERPAGLPLRLCSFSAPVCVHAANADGAAALAVLKEAEGAHHFMKWQARLPDPEGDGQAGGSFAADLYLVPLGGPSYRVGFETPARFPRDRAPVFALLDRSLQGCARSSAVYSAVATAHLAAIDGGEAGASFSSTAAYLAMEGSGCRGPALDAIDLAQSRPDQPLLPPGEVDDPRGSPLLPWWLDATLGGGAPGALITGLWYKSQQATRADFPRFRNVPDLMTVIGNIAQGRERKLDEFLLDLAVTRAFLGERDDGQHFPEAAWLGAAGRVRFEASWPHASLPRRLAFSPLSPTGSVYAWVDLAGAPEHPSLGFRATWEYPVTMRWALVRVSPSGEELSRMVLLHQRGATSAEGIVEALDGAAGLLIVGMNNGEIDLDEPFHLDETPYEPHGGTIHVFVPKAP